MESIYSFVIVSHRRVCVCIQRVRFGLFPLLGQLYCHRQGTSTVLERKPVHDFIQYPNTLLVLGRRPVVRPTVEAELSRYLKSTISDSLLLQD